MINNNMINPAKIR